MTCADTSTGEKIIAHTYKEMNKNGYLVNYFFNTEFIRVVGELVHSTDIHVHQCCGYVSKVESEKQV